jgi:proteasome assembly chaperone (PAC2) family protein
VERLYTLGGYGVGHLVEEARVLGAVNQPGLKDVVEAAGAIVGRDEPGGGIVGAAGLLLGLGLTRGIEGICLMGETSGYLVDPRSAASLLRVLSGLLEIEIDPTLLEQRAEEMEFMLQKLIDGDRISQDDELRYFV